MFLRAVAMAAVALTVTTAITGCKTEPAPIVIYEDKRDSIWLMFDPESGSGHSHPFEVSREQMARVMSGVYIKHRYVLAGFGMFFGDEEGEPAFTAAQIAFAAPHLAEALRKASPRDMATFYLTSGDKQAGKLVTSGGVFVREGKMFFILANARTPPYAVQYENTYAFDQRDQPLIPIAKKKFVVGFAPKEALLSNKQFRGKPGYEPYLDESKLVIIDLQKLSTLPNSPPTASGASPVPPRR